MKNCPNCGARVLYNICDYCGTLLEKEEKPKIIDQREICGSNNEWQIFVKRDEKGRVYSETYYRGRLIRKN